MKTSQRRGIAVALITGLVAALAGVPASALDDTKPGEGCAGLAFKDPKGDAIDGALLGLSSGNDNEDIIAGWFKYDGTRSPTSTRRSPTTRPI